MRPTEEVHHGRLDMTGDEKTVQRAYASDDVAWVQDVLCEERLLEADGTLVSRTRAFNGDSSIRTWRQVGTTLEAVDATYDAAGRPIRIGTYWEALQLDAAGRVLEERYGNGVRQVYARDELGLARLTDALLGAVKLPDGTLGQGTASFRLSYQNVRPPENIETVLFLARRSTISLGTSYGLD